jgi:hypothetical protein
MELPSAERDQACKHWRRALDLHEKIGVSSAETVSRGDEPARMLTWYSDVW